jgi:hypothetical protein
VALQLYLAVETIYTHYCRSRETAKRGCRDVVSILYPIKYFSIFCTHSFLPFCSHSLLLSRSHLSLTMSDDEGPASVHSASPAGIANSSGSVPVPADVYHNDEKKGSTPLLSSLQERDFIEPLSRRASFMGHLADSRESQFHVRDRSELERYFVCEPREGSLRQKTASNS